MIKATVMGINVQSSEKPVFGPRLPNRCRFPPRRYSTLAVISPGPRTDMKNHHLDANALNRRLFSAMKAPKGSDE